MDYQFIGLTFELIRFAHKFCICLPNVKSSNICQILQIFMNPLRHKKSSISFAISEKILSQLNSIIKTGKFTSYSDVVSNAIMFLISERTNSDFDYSAITENVPEDNSTKIKISIALNGYLDSELEKLAEITQKNKSFIVRMALFRFFDFYNNTDKIKEPVIVPEEKLLVSKNELEEIVQEMVNKILDKKK